MAFDARYDLISFFLYRLDTIHAAFIVCFLRIALRASSSGMSDFLPSVLFDLLYCSGVKRLLYCIGRSSQLFTLMAFCRPLLVCVMDHVLEGLV